jgi:hypothetical protein
VPVGAVFIVYPGERIPLDGRVLSDESSVLEELGGESAEVHARAAELANGRRSVVVVGSADHGVGSSTSQRHQAPAPGRRQPTLRELP